MIDRIEIECVMLVVIEPSKTISGRPIEVLKASNVGDLLYVDLVYLGRNERVYSFPRRQLLVTDGTNFWSVITVIDESGQLISVKGDEITEGVGRFRGTISNYIGLG